MKHVFGTTLALFVCAAVANATIITITFDPSQSTPTGQTGSAPAAESPASSLSYWGVTFASTEPSNPTVCSSGPSNTAPLCFSDAISTTALGLTFLQNDVLSGSLSNPDPLTGISSGTLTLTFSTPTTILDFGAVVGTGDQQPLSVALSGPQFTGASPATITLQAQSGLLAEGEFSYSGSPITQAVITFTSNNSTPIFAIDNLTYSTPQVPEPKSLALLGMGLTFICVQGRYRWFNRTNKS